MDASNASQCRYQRLLVNNNGWEIVRDDAGLWLIPPTGIDPQQQRRFMPSKSAALRDPLKTGSLF
jgi:hypothetical protein